MCARWGFRPPAVCTSVVSTACSAQGQRAGYSTNGFTLRTRSWRGRTPACAMRLSPTSSEKLVQVAACAVAQRGELSAGSTSQAYAGEHMISFTQKVWNWRSEHGGQQTNRGSTMQQQERKKTGLREALCCSAHTHMLQWQTCTAKQR